MHTTDTVEKSILHKAWKSSWKVSLMLLKIYLPIALFTALLKQTGILHWLAQLFAPFMKYFGLPGEAAITLLVGMVNSLFAALGTLSTIDLDYRQVTIVAIMLGMSHNLIMETAIMMKIGIARWKIFLSRVIFALIIGFLLHLFLPFDISGKVFYTPEGGGGFSWAVTLQKMGVTSIQIMLSMFLLMLGYESFTRHSFVEKIRRGLMPFMRWLGFSKDAIAPAGIGFFIGIAYGAGILLRMSQEKSLSLKDRYMTTIFLTLAHAMIEDTAIFVLVGANVFWILGVRMILAISITKIFSYRIVYRLFRWIGLPKT